MNPVDSKHQESLNFLWHLNFESNLWMKECPRSLLDEIVKIIEDEPQKIDEICLKGFSYAGKFGKDKKSSLYKTQIQKLCLCMNQRANSVILRASDLLNNKSFGHIYTPDTAITNNSYNRDKPAYEILCSFELMCKDTMKNGEVFLRLPEIKRADETLKNIFSVINYRFFDLYEPDKNSDIKKVGETLCNEQIKAVDNSMSNGVSYITGSAGRGKSSAIMEIIRRSSSTIICTPTHAARKVIKKRIEKTNLEEFCRADVGAFMQIHSKKYVNGKRCYSSSATKREKYLFEIAIDPDFPLETLVIEESSMMGIIATSNIIQYMTNAFPTLHRIIFVGDTKQLPSIGKGNVLEDLIRCSYVKGSTLTINHRSGSLSHNIDCILEGRPNDIILEDGKFEIKYVDEVEHVFDELTEKTNSYVTDHVVDEMVRLRKKKGYRTHTLCYMNSEVSRVNTCVSKLPRVGDLKDLKKGYKVRVKSPQYLTGDEESDICKNDILNIMGFTLLNNNKIDILLRDWPRTNNLEPSPVFNAIVYKDKLDVAFESGFATTVHSFQGDESDAIVVHAVKNCKYYDRLALYTAVSRARSMVSLVTIRGDKDWKSIVNSLNPVRISCLSETLDDKFIVSS